MNIESKVPTRTLNKALASYGIKIEKGKPVFDEIDLLYAFKKQKNMDEWCKNMGKEAVKYIQAQKIIEEFKAKVDLENSYVRAA